MENFPLKIFIKQVNLPERAVKNTVELLRGGATVPFISRYRKEMTGSLDEVDVGKIKEALQKMDELIKRKDTILKAIKEQDKLDAPLKKKIENCWDSIALEDIYLPFKKKVKTMATRAKENGLEPLARIITSERNDDLRKQAQRYINKNVPDVDAALEGARHIIAEWINENTDSRTSIRNQFSKYARIESKLVKKKKAEAGKYEMYFDYNEALNKIPSHRILAIFRAENEGLLRAKITIDNDYAQRAIERIFIQKPRGKSAEQIRLAIEDSLKRLLLPSIENEFKKSAKQKADEEAILVFSKNLKDLLLAAPLGNKRILAIDPGFRTGCKVVVLDEKGDLLHDTTIYPHPPQSKSDEAMHTLQHLVEKHKVEAVSIGNGTAGKETLQMVNKHNFGQELEVFFVNESGASIYSASKVAREEFPDKDVTVRGSISIGRRLMDPLAELVKIDPKSIGVGQYQYDVNQTRLKENLDNTIASCVNSVGINLNTASQHLLAHVSGLGPTLAKNIVEFRKDNGPFTERKQLLKVARMGNKAFEQAAGFLRIRDGKNPLDNTAVHPESYPVVKKILKDLKCGIDELMEDQDRLRKLDLKKYTSDQLGLPTLQDIQKELAKPGLDIRGKAKVIAFSNAINTIADLSIGMVLPGVVNNVTKFGAFVDIGIKESGLVHISEIVNRFISDPAEVLSVNQEVKVKVIAIDEEKRRVSLSMKQV